MAGRPRKPTALKRLQGTLQKCRTNPDEWTPPVGAPPEPEGLGPDGRKEWRRVVGQLMEAGVLAKIDGSVLELYVRAWQDERTYSQIARAEPMVETAFGSKVNPAWNAAHKARQLAGQLAGQFGMSPAARSKVSAPAQKGEEEARDEEFLFGGGLPVTQGKPNGVM